MEAGLHYELLDKKSLFCSFSDQFDEVEWEQQAREWFAKIDVDKDGKINQSELHHAFPQMSEKATRALVREADSDDDGLIDVDEWLAVARVYFEAERTIRSQPVHVR